MTGSVASMRTVITTRLEDSTAMVEVDHQQKDDEHQPSRGIDSVHGLFFC
jgi:hypothetical protein